MVQEPNVDKQPDRSESGDDGGSVSSSHRRLLTVLAAVLVLAALVAVGAFVVHRSGHGGGAEPAATTTGAPTKNDAYQALAAVRVKPSKADDLGGILVSKEGVGKPISAVPTVDIYMDFLCPPCGRLHRSLDPTLIAMVKAGQINLGIHFLDFLDQQRSDQYSTRAASAAASVAQEDPERFLDVVASFYKQDFQPSEQGGADVSDDQIAKRIMSVGVPEAVARKAASGEYREWVHQLNDYTITRHELENPEGESKGRLSTPTVIINGVFMQISHIKPGDDEARKALCQALGLDENQVGRAGSLPSIGGTGRPHQM
ncbi:protein-disulfide isomerase [Bifidobacterium actinocoloniiforme DSM 22766]|uniref:Protein-disulfide isomerase n=1 Tax=Bifidobacterium actinocoloniiforme DSM 22766 TaxID=1437605 RepID=A0A086Z0K0_9BIFI|nr:thioredoxin domain-containing protein [Bifidobacterium actinocoloniiforme]KFI40050.1 protein-disulfide isomerase [Bifidobacterium actinocoloniiforme DSM 22766]